MDCEDPLSRYWTCHLDALIVVNSAGFRAWKKANVLRGWRSCPSREKGGPIIFMAMVSAWKKLLAQFKASAIRGIRASVSGAETHKYVLVPNGIPDQFPDIAMAAGRKMIVAVFWCPWKRLPPGTPFKGHADAQRRTMYLYVRVDEAWPFRKWGAELRKLRSGCL